MRFLAVIATLLLPSLAAATSPDREFTVKTLDRIARPVIQALAEGKLKERFPDHPRPCGTSCPRS